MKRLSKKLSILLVLAIMLTSTLGMPFAMAETPQDQNRENVTDVDNTTDLPSQSLDGTIDIDLADYIIEEEIFLEPTTDNTETAPPQISGRSSTIGENTARANDLNQRLASRNNSPQSRTTDEYNDSIPIEGQYIDYGPFPVAPGEMIEAKLYAPVKSFTQYLLSIYYWNGVTWALIDYSMLGTGGGIVFESVGKINTLADTVYFIISVDALTNGDGNDDYNLLINTTSVYDNYEENNSIYYSGGFTVTNMTPPGQYFTLSANLHSSVDVDWFTFTVPTSANYSVLLFAENNTANVTYELFQNINGKLTIMAKGSNGAYSVTPGQTYYYRISASDTGAAYPRNYTFELRTYLQQQTTNIGLSVTRSNGSQLPIVTYSFGGTRYAVLQNEIIIIIITYSTANGAPNITEDDVVTATITNSAWNQGTYSYESTVQGTASGGIVTIQLPARLVYGQYVTYPGYSIRYTDTSVRFSITSAKYGSLYNDVIYLTTLY